MASWQKNKQKKKKTNLFLIAFIPRKDIYVSIHPMHFYTPWSALNTVVTCSLSRSQCDWNTLQGVACVGPYLFGFEHPWSELYNKAPTPSTPTQNAKLESLITCVMFCWSPRAHKVVFGPSFVIVRCPSVSEFNGITWKSEFKVAFLNLICNMLYKDSKIEIGKIFTLDCSSSVNTNLLIKETRKKKTWSRIETAWISCNTLFFVCTSV